MFAIIVFGRAGVWGGGKCLEIVVPTRPCGTAEADCSLSGQYVRPVAQSRRRLTHVARAVPQDRRGWSADPVASVSSSCRAAASPVRTTLAHCKF